MSGIKQLLDGDSDDDSVTSKLDPSPTPWSGEQAYLFSFNSLASTLTMFHPPPVESNILWRIFVDQVDPVIRMLHKPTMQKSLAEAESNLAGLNKPFEALIFSIYFASVTSMSEEDCRTHLQESKDSLLRRYRFAVQQSFARAEFLRTHSVVTLQALILYLVRLQESS